MDPAADLLVGLPVIGVHARDEDASGELAHRYHLLRFGVAAYDSGRPWPTLLPFRALVADLDVRVLTENGELLRALTLDPSRDYQAMKRS